jgi:hypothetical protein
MKILLKLIIILLASLAHAAHPLPKTGSCPAGYVASGGYCKPGRSARFAVEKHGGCPAGYQPSGGFCLAGKSGRTAVRKVGACPAGWQASGNYCLER